MYISLITTFLLFLVIVIAAIQNSMLLDLKFLTLEFQMSLAALVVYSSLIGGMIVTILTLPKLIRKSHRVRKGNKEIHALQEKIVVMGKEHTVKPST
jgi:uncharacterized integral membrane protein